MNMVSGIDTMTKIREYVTHQKLDMMAFDNEADQTFEKQRERLEKHTYVPDHHNEDIFQIVDKLTSSKKENMEDFNILYDRDMNKILIYVLGDWQELLDTQGLISMAETIQKYFWDAYECFLIRNIERGEDAVMMRERLDDLYRILAILDSKPCVNGKNNNQILYVADDEEYRIEPEWADVSAHTIEDTYMPIYTKIKQKLSAREKGETKKKILDIVKRNTKKCMMNLNKLITNLNADFRVSMIPALVSN